MQPRKRPFSGLGRWLLFVVGSFHLPLPANALYGACVQLHSYGGTLRTRLALVARRSSDAYPP
jgi:hypothetical protein